MSMDKRKPAPVCVGALALCLIFTRAALAHSMENTSVKEDQSNDTTITWDMLAYPPTYFSHPSHVGLIYAHISLMLIAWVLVLPIAVMLSLVASRHTLASQYLFLGINALGLVLGVIYDANTPDLYPNNAHRKVGWLLTWVVSAQVLIGLTASAGGAVSEGSPVSCSEALTFIPVSSEHIDHDSHLSNINGQYNEPELEPVCDQLIANIGGSTIDNEGLPLRNTSKEYCQAEAEDFQAGMSSFAAVHHERFVNKPAKALTHRVLLYLDLLYRIVDRTILPLGFIALCSGIATFGRFFEDKAIFNGLAHWIKGGVFFWLGLFTLGRWTGSFGELGWAWNVRPPATLGRWRPSAEFVESALILLYGSTNIFLEHLGHWGGSWTPQDLEHVSITVLFVGGGLCGMLVESRMVRTLLNTTLFDVVASVPSSGLEPGLQTAPATYDFSLNPIPALVILLLGVTMSSHQQSTVISSIVHKQWGNLLSVASFARFVTYILVFLRPPKSVLPSRPPSELLTSFALIAGGIIFMASSTDTITAMVHYKLDAMLIYTITMGSVGILMAWVVLVLAIKGWAIRRELGIY